MSKKIRLALVSAVMAAGAALVTAAPASAVGASCPPLPITCHTELTGAGLSTLNYEVDINALALTAWFEASLIHLDGGVGF
ncbi:hypothetical protein D5S17_20150 [Pseudonocardiaceae bacterium YIM PH 21723]|nr:hypothetical protein D5S17_20150 [Pseudonocardiaceae bacterium YIM PH 21723]